jgi:uncharacterized protein YxeA
MKKIYIWIVLIAVLVLLFIFFWIRRETGDTVQSYVKENYMNSDHVISTFKTGENKQYLSESLGLYMNYLLLAKDKEGFREQVDVLEEIFVVEKNMGNFVRWSLDEQAGANALIDDVRITQALINGAKLFDEQKYKELALNLNKSIFEHQHNNGIYSDFIDWNYGEPAARITLSYLTEDFFLAFHDTELTEQLLLNTSYDNLFFPEYYDIKTQNYQYGNEVHMVDQLLIAINKVNRGQQELTSFNEWLLSSWRDDGKIYGRYDRDSGEALVSYESLAVYAFAYEYLTLIGEEQFAESMWEHAVRLEQSIVPEEKHFFDYILFHTVNDYSTIR